jgi:UDP-2-acetamido-3-amino-2,3-dideoxy-glucuronate N-acetyltransferase
MKTKRRLWKRAVKQAGVDLGHPKNFSEAGKDLATTDLGCMIQRLVKKQRAGVMIWSPANVYPSAKLGKQVSIGTFCEIGHLVSIGDDSRIGAMTFIPEGVTIGKRVFIGPRVTFTNDKRPPSPKSEWLKTVVEDGARIGAAVTILPGLRIGAGALIGSGAVVTKSVPPGEVWAGVPAKRLKGRK